jgi:hypothetical protein
MKPWFKAETMIWSWKPWFKTETNADNHDKKPKQWPEVQTMIWSWQPWTEAETKPDNHDMKLKPWSDAGNHDHESMLILTMTIMMWSWNHQWVLIWTTIWIGSWLYIWRLCWLSAALLTSKKVTSTQDEAGIVACGCMPPVWHNGRPTLLNTDERDAGFSYCAKTLKMAPAE